MCGIIGTVGRDERAVQRALATFSYRGPDAKGYFSDESFSLGHARLSIIDLDSRSNQPFFDTENKVGIVFNGEIYNYLDLRRELERDHGIAFRTTSDTEVLLYGYTVWKEAMLPKLRGMFAFAVYDTREATIFLARDHAGIKPLYYSLEGGLRFASGLKGVVELLRQSGVRVELDTESIAMFPVIGYVPSPFTSVRGVKKLSRGSWLRYDLRAKKCATGNWQPAGSSIRSIEELQAAVRDSIFEHTIADVPVGTFFSGGVDSSLIVATLKEAKSNVEAFSIRVSGRGADEPYFREIAKHFGVKAHVADFGVKEFDELYEYVFGRMDDPIADTSIFPTALVSKLAAQRVKVVLSGEGGDELFLGYPRILGLSRMRGQRRMLSSIYSAGLLKMPSFRGKNKLWSAAASALQLPAPYYLLQVSPARDLSPNQAWQRVQRDMSAGEPLWFDRDWYLENMLLRKTDMATMYASIEGRVPLLGAALWQAAPSFAKDNLANGGGKNILKDMLARHVPRELIDRPKSGFGISIGAIMRESKFLRPNLHEALRALEPLGLADPRDEDMIAERYPVWGFGAVALHRSLQNLQLI